MDEEKQILPFTIFDFNPDEYQVDSEGNILNYPDLTRHWPSMMVNGDALLFTALVKLADELNIDTAELNLSFRHYFDEQINHERYGQIKSQINRVLDNLILYIGTGEAKRATHQELVAHLNGLTNDIVKIIRPDIELIAKRYSLTEQFKLFRNQNSFDSTRGFGMPRQMAHILAHAIKKADDELLRMDMEKRKTGRIHGYTTKDNHQLSLDFRPDPNKINEESIDDFIEYVHRIKSPVVFQTLLHIWDYANHIGRFTFDIKLTDLMEYAGIKKPPNGYYNQEQRREFTQRIYVLTNFSTRLEYQNGKKTAIMDDVRLVKVHLRIHANKKDGTPNEDVLSSFRCELLPGFPRRPMLPWASFISRGLCQLDPNRDGRVLTAGFQINMTANRTRVGNVTTGKDNKHIKNIYTRADLIELFELTTTDKNHKSVASQRLKKGLEKLIKVNVIAGYSPKKISTKDNQQITIISHQEVK